jgi:hypothetical protein
MLANIVYIEIALQIPYAQSLKDKRRSVKSLKERLQSRFNVSVAEIGFLDEWQHSVIGAVMISNDRQYLQVQASSIESFLIDIRDVVITDINVQWL